MFYEWFMNNLLSLKITHKVQVSFVSYFASLVDRLVIICISRNKTSLNSVNRSRISRKYIFSISFKLLLFHNHRHQTKQFSSVCKYLLTKFRRKCLFPTINQQVPVYTTFMWKCFPTDCKKTPSSHYESTYGSLNDF